MKKRTLKLHKTKIVAFTKYNTIKGGTDVTENTCAIDGTCDDMTDDKNNGNNSLPTFNRVSIFGC